MNIFMKIKQFFYLKSKKFKNQLKQEINYAKFREQNQLNDINFKSYIQQNYKN